MLIGILVFLALALTALGYAFKLDFLKFIAGAIWIPAGILTSYNYTWFGSAQWVFLLISFFGLALPTWIHTIWSMSLNRKDKALKKSTALYTDGDTDSMDDEDEETKQAEALMKKYARKPTRRSQRSNSLFGG